MLQLRSSVPEITPSLEDPTAPVVQLSRAFCNRMLRGNPAEAQAPHAVFDRPEELPTPNISVR